MEKKLGGKEREKNVKKNALTVSSEKVHGDIMADYRDKEDYSLF